MKSFIVIFVCNFLFFACSGSPLKTGAKAEENKYRMSFIYKGMSEYEVQSVMGRPHKKEIRVIDNEEFDVWFYLTRRVGLTQSKLLPRNFTPFIFQNDTLLGWGYNFYNHLLDIEGAREDRAGEMRQRYTDDEDEWTPGDHQLLTPDEDGAQEPLPIDGTYEMDETMEITPDLEKKTRPGKQERRSKQLFNKE